MNYFTYQEHKTRDRTKDVPEGFVAAEWPAIVVTEHETDETEARAYVTTPADWAKAGRE